MAKSFKTKSGLTIDGEYVYNLQQTVSSWRNPYKQNWLDYYKLYRSYRSESDYPFRSNIFVPFTFSLVETITPLMLGALFNTEPLMSVTARKGAVYQLAQVLEEGLSYFFEDDRLGLYFQYEDFLKECAMYGTSFARILPKLGSKTDYNSITGKAVPRLDYIDLEPIDLFKVYPDWRAKDINSMRFIIIEHDKELDDLYELAEQGIIPKNKLKEVEQWLESSTKIDEGKQERLQEAGITGSYPTEMTSENRKVVKVLEYWDKNCTLWVAGNGTIVLKEDKNPFDGLFPFIMMQFCRIPHELYGMGIPEMVSTLQDELNTVRNQRMDNINLIINRMWVANKLADVDFENLVSYAGNIILTNDMDAIQPLKTQDVTQSAYKEEEVIIGDIENVTGVFRYQRGGPPQRRETATGIIRLQQAANTRFDAILKAIEYGPMRQQAKLFLWYMRRFLIPERFATIVGPKEFFEGEGPAFYMIPLDEILKAYHFKPMGSSITAIKELRAQQILQAFQLVAGLVDPITQVPIVNLREFARMILKEVFDLKNIDRLLLPPPLQGGMPGQQPGMPGGQPGGAAPGAALLPGQAGTPQRMGGEVASNEGQNAANMLKNLAITPTEVPVGEGM